jgi:hypothetical protein
VSCFDHGPILCLIWEDMGRSFQQPDSNVVETINLVGFFFSEHFLGPEDEYLNYREMRASSFWSVGFERGIFHLSLDAVLKNLVFYSQMHFWLTSFIFKLSLALLNSSLLSAL